MHFGYFLFAFLTGSVTAAPPSSQPISDPGQAEQAGIRFSSLGLKAGLATIHALLSQLNNPSLAYELSEEINLIGDIFPNLTLELKNAQEISEMDISIAYKFLEDITPQISDGLKEVWQHLNPLAYMAYFGRMMDKFSSLYARANVFIKVMESIMPPSAQRVASIEKLHENSIIQFRKTIYSDIGFWTNLNNQVVCRILDPSLPPIPLNGDLMVNAAYRELVAAHLARVAVQQAPITAYRVPIARNRAPITRQRAPIAAQPVPITRQRAPIAAQPVPITRQRAPIVAPVDLTGENAIEDLCRGDRSRLSTPNPGPSRPNLITQLCAPYQPNYLSFGGGACPSHLSTGGLVPYLDPGLSLAGSPKSKAAQNPTDRMQTEDGSADESSTVHRNLDLDLGLGLAGSSKSKARQNPTNHMQTKDVAGPSGAPIELEPVHGLAEGSSTIQQGLDLDLGLRIAGTPKSKAAQNLTDHMQTEDGAGPSEASMELESVQGRG